MWSAVISCPCQETGTSWGAWTLPTNYWTRKLPWHNCFSPYVSFYQGFQNTRICFSMQWQRSRLSRPCSSHNPTAELQETTLAPHTFQPVCTRERGCAQFNSCCLVSVLKCKETCLGWILLSLNGMPDLISPLNSKMKHSLPLSIGKYKRFRF